MQILEWGIERLNDPSRVSQWKLIGRNEKKSHKNYSNECGFAFANKSCWEKSKSLSKHFINANEERCRHQLHFLYIFLALVSSLCKVRDFNCDCECKFHAIENGNRKREGTQYKCKNHA